MSVNCIVLKWRHLPFPHTEDRAPCVLLKQRTGSRSSHASACGAPPSPHWPVWSGFWWALWQGCGGSHWNTSGWSRGKPETDKDRRWWISAWCCCVALKRFSCAPRWRGPANADATASTFNHCCGSTRSPRPESTLNPNCGKNWHGRSSKVHGPKSQSLDEEKYKKTRYLHNEIPQEVRRCANGQRF